MAGDLVIAGGALASHADDVFNIFIELAGGTSARFAVLCAASGKPAASFSNFASKLEALGIPRTHIELLEVSPVVPGWERGAWAESEIRKLASADGLWMTGGDQSRITASLFSKLGDNSLQTSPLLDLLRERNSVSHADGGIAVGGSSAGAAVMSDPMICAGTSLGALNLPLSDKPGDGEISDALCLAPGLGLFREGIVDQHFDTRARFARLLTAAMTEPREQRRLAFGIAEDTALIQQGSAQTLSVVGKGGVFVIDTRVAERSQLADGKSEITGGIFHYLTEGDFYSISDKELDFSAKRRILSTEAGFAVPRPIAVGPLSPYGDLASFVCRMLMDNRPEELFRDPATGLPCVRGLLCDSIPDWSALNVQSESNPVFSGWEICFMRTDGQNSGRESSLFYDEIRDAYSCSNIPFRIFRFSAHLV